MQQTTGGVFRDNRGTIRHVNDFNFVGVKRFYTIYHPETTTIRAWQGHKVEVKWFYVIKGSFKLQWIKIDDWHQPDNKLIPKSIILSDKESKIIKLEGGYANGFKAMEPDSIIMVYSDMTVEESKMDNYRWEWEYFGEAEW